MALDWDIGYARMGDVKLGFEGRALYQQGCLAYSYRKVSCRNLCSHDRFLFAHLLIRVLEE